MTTPLNTTHDACKSESVTVDPYHTDCCHSGCPSLNVSESETNHTCLWSGAKLERFGFWTGTKACLFQRCRECMLAYPDPECVPVTEVPDFVIGHQYRFRYKGKTKANLCAYVETDNWGRHVFRCGEPGEGMLMWWEPGSDYLEWVA